MIETSTNLLLIFYFDIYVNSLTFFIRKIFSIKILEVNDKIKVLNNAYNLLEKKKTYNE